MFFLRFVAQWCIPLTLQQRTISQADRVRSHVEPHKLSVMTNGPGLDQVFSNYAIQKPRIHRHRHSLFFFFHLFLLSPLHYFLVFLAIRNYRSFRNRIFLRKFFAIQSMLSSIGEKQIFRLAVNFCTGVSSLSYAAGDGYHLTSIELNQTTACPRADSRVCTQAKQRNNKLAQAS